LVVQVPWSTRTYTWFYDQVQSRYYDLLVKWCFLPLGGERKVRRALAEEVELRPGDRILDMGCGTGGTTFALAAKAGPRATVKGIDLSRGQIRRARRKNRFGNVELLVGEASATGFPAAAFDRVVIAHLLHERPRPRRMDVLREARRLLASGGGVTVLELDTPPDLAWRLLLAFWWFYWLPFNFETPTRRDMLRWGVEEEVREAGFKEVAKVSLFHGSLQVVSGRK